MPQSSIDPIVATNIKAVLHQQQRSAYAVATAMERAPNWLYRVINQDAGILLPTLRLLADELGVSVAELVDPHPNGEYAAPEMDRIHGMKVVAAQTGKDSQYDDIEVGVWPVRLSWLKQLGVNPAHSRLLSAAGRSMEPTIPDGADLVIDCDRRRLREDRIYVVESALGLVARRACKNLQGWWLLADNPRFTPQMLDDSYEVIGEVHYIGITLT